MMNLTKVSVMCFLVTIFMSSMAFSATNDVQNNVESNIKTFYSYHSTTAGFVLTNNEKGCEFMEKYFPGYVYDGKREWRVVRTGVGFYSKYVGNDTILYTNSVVMKVFLNLSGLMHSTGWFCQEMDAEYLDEEIDLMD